MQKADIGLIGLAVMGENLVLNMEEKGFTVAVHNRSLDKVERFLAGEAQGKKIIGCYSLEELTQVLTPPRKVMLLVKAGQPVDDYIERLLILLEPGDVIIDGGNSHFSDTIRRTAWVESHGLLYLGLGVSGGETGARQGPSLMPGGSPTAWTLVQPILQAVCARVADGSPCCEWVGEDGAGHFVKMVHNGIEYGDMQLIGEAYQLLRDLLGLDAPAMSRVFAAWNEGELNSYLIEITRDILAYRDEDGSPLVDKILDTAGQKGTGKWTAVTALDAGVPLTLIGQAVFARFLSAQKEARLAAAAVFNETKPAWQGDADNLITDIRQALYASKVVAYAQGYDLMRSAAAIYDWNLNYGGIALLWRGGCIIRSAFLSKIEAAYRRDPQLASLLLDPYFTAVIKECLSAWRRVVSTAALHGVPTPALAAALAYFDGYTCGRLPANLLQAQRDYFGAHTYERIDAPRGCFFHTNWTGAGGTTASSDYRA